MLEFYRKQRISPACKLFCQPQNRPCDRKCLSTRNIAISGSVSSILCKPRKQFPPKNYFYAKIFIVLYTQYGFCENPLFIEKVNGMNSKEGGKVLHYMELYWEVPDENIAFFNLVVY